MVSPVLGDPFKRLQAFALELKGFLALGNGVRYQVDVRVPIGSSLRKLLAGGKLGAHHHSVIVKVEGLPKGLHPWVLLLVL